MKIATLTLALLASTPAWAGDFSAEADFRLLLSGFSELNRHMDDLRADMEQGLAGQASPGTQPSVEVNSRGNLNFQIGLGAGLKLDPQWSALARLGLGMPTRFSVKHRADTGSGEIKGAYYLDCSLYSLALGGAWQSPLFFGMHRAGLKALGGLGFIQASEVFGTTLTSSSWPPSSTAFLGSESYSGISPHLDLSAFYLADLEYSFTFTASLGWLYAKAPLSNAQGQPYRGAARNLPPLAFDYSGLSATLAASYEF